MSLSSSVVLEPLSQSLPLVRTLATKVGRVHGAHNPNLVALASAVLELDEVLMPHLESEAEGGLAAPSTDREVVSGLLGRIRSLSEDFTVPSWGCSSYRTLFSELKQVDGVVSAWLG
jgi:iron-sulfur cluster repair protein YtfE (RIC family)